MPAVTLQGGSRNQYLPEDPTCIQTHNMTSKTARRSNNLSFSFPVVQICCVQFSSSPSGGRGRRSRFSAEAWNAAQQQMAHLPRLSWASPWESNFFRKQTAHLPQFSWASPWESIFLERKKKKKCLAARSVPSNLFSARRHDRFSVHVLACSVTKDHTKFAHVSWSSSL